MIVRKSQATAPIERPFPDENTVAEMCCNEAHTVDNEAVEDWTSSLQMLLTFAAVFSAVLVIPVPIQRHGPASVLYTGNFELSAAVLALLEPPRNGWNDEVQDISWPEKLLRPMETKDGSSQEDDE